MKLTHTLSLIMALFAFVVAPSVASAKVARPLEPTVPVGEVQQQEYTILPDILWGGEYNQLYANGVSVKTTPSSIFGQLGLKFELWVENDVQKLLDAYISGRTPYFRGTMDMGMAPIEAMNRDPRTKPILLVVMTRSTGGDTAVVIQGIQDIGDWKGKRIALQLPGPHMFLLHQLLKTAGLSLNDVTIVSATTLEGPMELMQDGKADVAFCIFPHMEELTKGSGEGRVDGARMGLSTMSFPNFILDVYYVRSDYFQSHKDEAYKLVQGLIKAQDQLTKLFKNQKSAEFKKLALAFQTIISQGAESLDSCKGMVMDFTFAQFSFNQKFFDGNQKAFPSFTTSTYEIQTALIDYGYMTRRVPLEHANWDWERLKSGAGLEVQATKPKFNQKAVAAAVKKRQTTGTLSEGTLFPTFEVYFKAKQTSFAASQYASEFDKVIADVQRAAGAAIVLEAHVEQQTWLSKKKSGMPTVRLTQLRQKAVNVSMQRGEAVKDAIIAYAKSSQGIELDESQFSILPLGIEDPRAGMCGRDPCPTTREDWPFERRVAFRIVIMEVEADVFPEL